jgi:hypothetical protein
MDNDQNTISRPMKEHLNHDALFRNIRKNYIHTVQRFCFKSFERLFENSRDTLGKQCCVSTPALLWQPWEGGEDLDVGGR